VSPTTTKEQQPATATTTTTKPPPWWNQSPSDHLLRLGLELVGLVTLKQSVAKSTCEMVHCIVIFVKARAQALQQHQSHRPHYIYQGQSMLESGCCCGFCSCSKWAYRCCRLWAVQITQKCRNAVAFLLLPLHLFHQTKASFSIPYRIEQLLLPPLLSLAFTPRKWLVESARMHTIAREMPYLC
jgi:hypothetical protein